MPDKSVDKNDQELQDQIVTLRSTSKEFVALLQSLKLPAPVLTQLQKFLENVGTIPGQVVDLLMSTIESTYDEKILILDAVDLKVRIPKAVELLTRQIHVEYQSMFVSLVSLPPASPRQKRDSTIIRSLILGPENLTKGSRQCGRQAQQEAARVLSPSTDGSDQGRARRKGLGRRR